MKSPGKTAVEDFGVDLPPIGSDEREELDKEILDQFIPYIHVDPAVAAEVEALKKVIEIQKNDNIKFREHVSLLDGEVEALKVVVEEKKVLIRSKDDEIRRLEERIRNLEIEAAFNTTSRETVELFETENAKIKAQMTSKDLKISAHEEIVKKLRVENEEMRIYWENKVRSAILTEGKLQSRTIDLEHKANEAIVKKHEYEVQYVEVKADRDRLQEELRVSEMKRNEDKNIHNQKIFENLQELDTMRMEFARANDEKEKVQETLELSLYRGDMLQHRLTDALGQTDASHAHLLKEIESLETVAVDARKKEKYLRKENKLLQMNNIVASTAANDVMTALINQKASVHQQVSTIAKMEDSQGFIMDGKYFDVNHRPTLMSRQSRLSNASATSTSATREETLSPLKSPDPKGQAWESRGTQRFSLTEGGKSPRFTYSPRTSNVSKAVEGIPVVSSKSKRPPAKEIEALAQRALQYGENLSSATSNHIDMTSGAQSSSRSGSPASSHVPSNQPRTSMEFVQGLKYQNPHNPPPKPVEINEHPVYERFEDVPTGLPPPTDSVTVAQSGLNHRLSIPKIDNSVKRHELDAVQSKQSAGKGKKKDRKTKSKNPKLRVNPLDVAKQPSAISPSSIANVPHIIVPGSAHALEGDGTDSNNPTVVNILDHAAPRPYVIQSPRIPRKREEYPRTNSQILTNESKVIYYGAQGSAAHQRVKSGIVTKVYPNGAPEETMMRGSGEWPHTVSQGSVTSVPTSSHSNVSYMGSAGMPGLLGATGPMTAALGAQIGAPGAMPVQVLGIQDRVRRKHLLEKYYQLVVFVNSHGDELEASERAGGDFNEGSGVALGLGAIGRNVSNESIGNGTTVPKVSLAHTVDMADVGMTNDELKGAIDWFSVLNLHQVQRLDLRQNCITDEGVMNLVVWILSFSTIDLLRARPGNAASLDDDSLEKDTSGAASVLEIDLRNNFVSNECASIIVNMIQKARRPEVKYVAADAMIPEHGPVVSIYGQELVDDFKQSEETCMRSPHKSAGQSQQTSPVLILRIDLRHSRNPKETKERAKMKKVALKAPASAKDFNADNDIDYGLYTYHSMMGEHGSMNYSPIKSSEKGSMSSTAGFDHSKIVKPSTVTMKREEVNTAPDVEHTVVAERFGMHHDAKNVLFPRDHLFVPEIPHL